MKKEERVESFVDDEVEDRGNADLDEILAVLQNPSSHFGTGQTLRVLYYIDILEPNGNNFYLHFEEI